MTECRARELWRFVSQRYISCFNYSFGMSEQSVFNVAYLSTYHMSQTGWSTPVDVRYKVRG